ncbi:DEAD/DEAH box helicase family protein [Mycobacterium xenopi 4042]|uniref:DEAD/DEAH box helicase family protein n=1 Tax=Mycobacterium xenopi 4042 TaxID=1299334 RepID=X8E6C2_MYCXE|nr:DEAD/DEAH box helicase family protein [Mycobacterium xenopi 4042]
MPDLLAAAVAAIGGSQRSGQLEMATAVAHAFETGEHLAVQAGTGTGKSLAYLVPAIVRAVCDDTPVVVSTATIALQRQLVDRDLPQLVDALADALPRRPRFALLKGRQNYLCLNKIHNGTDADTPQDELFEPLAVTALGRDVQRLTAWASTTDTGTATTSSQAWRTGRGRTSACRRGNAWAWPAARSAVSASPNGRVGAPALPILSSPTTRCWPSTPSPNRQCCPITSSWSSTKHTNWPTGSRRWSPQNCRPRAGNCPPARQSLDRF